MNIAVIGKRAQDRIFVTKYLELKYNFKQIRISEGVYKLIRTVYALGYNKRAPWPLILRIYDDLYKVDPDMQVNYLLARAALTTKKHLICDDLRYGSELTKLKENGWKVIRITSTKGGTKVGARINKHSSAGTLVLSEFFEKSEANLILADYSVWREDGDKTRAILDEIMKSLGLPKYIPAHMLDTKGTDVL